MKNNPLILVLVAFCLFLTLPTYGWGTNERTNTNLEENYSCTLKMTATPNGVYCGEYTGSIEVKITGGKAPYKIEWDNSDNSIWAKTHTSNDTYTIKDLPKGTYQIKVTDSKGCYDKDSHVTLDVNASNLTYTLETNDPCAAAGSLTIRISNSSAPYWVILEGPTSGAVVVNSNAFRINDLLPGHYKVIVDKDGCGHEQSATLITTPTPLSVSISQEDTNECDAFGDIMLNIHGGTAEYFVSWYGATNGNTRSYGSKPIQNLAPGDYTFTVRDANFCTASTTVTVKAAGTDLACVLTQTPVICDNMGQIGVAIHGGEPTYRVDYSGPVSGAVIASTTGDHSATASIWDLPPGYYSILVTDSRGCTASETITVGGQLTDLACIVTQTPVICDNMGQIGISISGGQPSYQVEYVGPASGIISATTIGERSATANIMNLPAGYYTIYVTDSRGCVATETITVGGEPTDLACIVTQTPVICDNMGQIGVSISGGQPSYRVEYVGPASGIISATTIGERSATANIMNLPAGYYTIYVTDSRGCVATETITVGGEPTDLACIVTQTPVICDNMGQIGVSISGGQPSYRVEYVGPASGIISATTIGERSATANIMNLPAGYYTIYVTDSRGCVAVETITVGGEPTDLACIVTQTPVICDNMGQIGVSISGGQPSYRVEYVGPASGIISATTTGERTATASISNLPTGYYTIYVTDSRGCVAVETITVGGTTTDMAMALSVNPLICASTAGINVDISGGYPNYTVYYSGPVSGTVETSGYSVFIPLPLGYYTIIVTDANGCSVTKTAEVGTGVDDLHCRLVQTHAICTKNGFIEVIISGGKPGFYVSWTAGHISGSATTTGYSYIIEAPCPGTYDITVTDANGCTVMESTTVRQLENNLAFTLIAHPGQQEGDGSIQVTFQSGKPYYTIELTGPVTKTTISSEAVNFYNLPSGYYSVFVTDANGCNAQYYVTVPAIGGGMKISIEVENKLTNTSEKSAAENTNQTVTEIPIFGSSTAKSAIFEVYQNAPNPFTTSTTISFNLPTAMKALITIHNHLGKTVSSFKGEFAKGYNEYQFNRSDIGSGVLYYTVQAGEYSKTTRMLHIE